MTATSSSRKRPLGDAEEPLRKRPFSDIDSQSFLSLLDPDSRHMIACYCGTTANWIADPTRLKLINDFDLSTDMIPIISSMYVNFNGIITVGNVDRRKGPELYSFNPYTDSPKHIDVHPLPFLPDACALSTTNNIYIAYRAANRLNLIRRDPDWTREYITLPEPIAHVDNSAMISMDLSVDERSLFILIRGVRSATLYTYDAETLATKSITNVIVDDGDVYCERRRALVTCAGCTTLIRQNGLVFNRKDTDKDEPSSLKMSQGFASLTLSFHSPMAAARDSASRLYIVENAGLGPHQCLSVYDETGVCAQLPIDVPLSKHDRCRTFIAGHNRVVALCGTKVLTFAVPK